MHRNKVYNPEKLFYIHLQHQVSGNPKYPLTNFRSIYLCRVSVLFSLISFPLSIDDEISDLRLPKPGWFISLGQLYQSNNSMILERIILPCQPIIPSTQITPKARITFTYSTPFKGPKLPLRSPSYHDRYSSTQPLHSKSASSFLGQPIKQNKHNENLGKRNCPRKKIFDCNSNHGGKLSYSNELSVSMSNRNQRNKTQSALHYSDIRRKKKRNTIFQDYRPKPNTSLENQTLNETSYHLFPIRRPADPKSLIHYVDLENYRKNPQPPTKNRVSQTYISEGRNQEERQFRSTGFKVSDQASEVLIPFNSNHSATELQLDESIKQFCQKQTEKVSDPLGHLLESVPRFYDNLNGDEIPPIPKTKSYVDINLLKSTTTSEWLKTAKVQQNKSLSFFVKELRDLWGKAFGQSNLLPIGLLFLGVLLFFIQLTK